MTDHPDICDVCGGNIALDECICPPCPVCSEVGCPACYTEHGMTRTQAQIDQLAAVLADQAA